MGRVSSGSIEGNVVREQPGASHGGLAERGEDSGLSTLSKMGSVPGSEQRADLM